MVFNNNTHRYNFIRPVYYCDNSKCSLPWLLLDKISKQGELKGKEFRKMMTDLYLLKPVYETLYDPNNVYSVILEREWRYVSYSSVFSFRKNMVEKVIISRLDYEKWLNGNEDKTLDVLIRFCRNNQYPMEFV